MIWSANIAAQVGACALDVDISADGEPVALIGPNGSGKTSLLRALCGAIPCQGSFVLDGQTLLKGEQGIDVAKRRLGYVPQSVSLFPHLNALDNVGFGVRGTKEEREHIAFTLLERFDCAHIVFQYPNTLSGGEQQRVALARALASSPKLLLLDEPMSAIDMPSKRRIREAVLETADELECAILLVTHDVRDVVAFDAFVVAIEAGRVVQVGEISQLAQSPATPFIRDFCEA